MQAGQGLHDSSSIFTLAYQPAADPAYSMRIGKLGELIFVTCVTVQDVIFVIRYVCNPRIRRRSLLGIKSCLMFGIRRPLPCAQCCSLQGASRRLNRFRSNSNPSIRFPSALQDPIPIKLQSQPTLPPCRDGRQRWQQQQRVYHLSTVTQM